MTTKLQKWGNSLGVRIPKDIVKRAKLKDGKSISIKNIGSSIVITAYSKKEILDDLISKITPENRYDELYWGPPVGNEVW
ncbi:MAG: AbrB/MazE/SpoVT family DNA-binding domain-containing protein [Patescibacteria group bacterium]